MTTSRINKYNYKALTTSEKWKILRGLTISKYRKVDETWQEQQGTVKCDCL